MTVSNESELIHEDFQRVIKGFLWCLTHNASLRVPASKRNEKMILHEYGIVNTDTVKYIHK